VGAFVAPTDGGYNLTDPGDTSCKFSSANHDVLGNPQLGPLTDNGGPTPTQMPGASSPAINAIPTGTAGLCAAGLTDQRGVARPVGDACDIGSVETDLHSPVLHGPASVTFTTGQAGTFSYTSTGVPTAHLSEAGSLPAGLTFVDNGDGTATLSGTPAAGTGGSYPITVTATNGFGPDATMPVTVTVDQPPTVKGPATATFVVNAPGTPVTFTTTGFPTPSLEEAGALPGGVTFVDNHDGTATLSGTPTDAGTFTITVTASNGVAPDASTTFTLTVAPPVSVTTTSLPGGQVGVTYHASLSATGGVAPYRWSISAGSLPAGLSLAPDGTISGVPSGNPGTSTFTVEVQDSLSPPASATAVLSITISRGPSTLTVQPVLLSTNPLTIKVGVVKAKLTGGNPAIPLGGQPIVFKAGSTTVCTANTQADGTVACQLSETADLLVIANLGVTASFAGNTQYLPSSAHAGLL
jgi:hypothetical protein